LKVQRPVHKAERNSTARTVAVWSAGERLSRSSSTCEVHEPASTARQPVHPVSERLHAGSLSSAGPTRKSAAESSCHFHVTQADIQGRARMQAASNRNWHLGNWAAAC